MRFLKTMDLRLIVLLMCLVQALASKRRHSGGAPLCSLDEIELRREIRRCVKIGDRFVRKYFDAMTKKNGKSGCSLFANAHGCFRDLFSKCSAAENMLSPDWLHVYKVMDCQCSNKSEDCVTAVPCFELEHKSILVLRCDDYLHFNKRQKTRHHCHFLHENIQCKESLVTSACGDYAGNFSFHLYKYKERKELSRPHHCPHLRREDQYHGFRYSAECPPHYTDDLFDCEKYFHQANLNEAFHKANDLVFARDAESVHAACAAYRSYEECRDPIENKCPRGVKLLEDYEEQIRTLRMKLRYICQYHKQEYINNLPCYQTVIHNQTLKICNEKFEALKPIMNSVLAHQFYCQRNSNDTQRLYTALDDLRICYEETFIGACGREGGTIMSGLMTEAFRDPLYLRYSYEPDCNLHTPDENDVIDDVTTSDGDRQNDRVQYEPDYSEEQTDETYTYPTKQQSKNPHKDYTENEVIDVPEAGQRVSSASWTPSPTRTTLLLTLLVTLVFPT